MSTTVTKSPQGAPALAILHAPLGSLLILVGLLRFLNIILAEDPRGTSPLDNFPWTTIGMLHLAMAWTLWKSLRWYWVPNLLLLPMWLVGPIMAVAMVPHSGGPPSGMVGSGPAFAFLVLAAFVIIPVLLLLVQWAYLARRSDWSVSSAKDYRFSLRQFLCFCTLVPAIFGMDLLPHLKVIRTQEKFAIQSRHKQEEHYSQSRLARVERVQQEQDRIEAVTNLTDALTQGIFNNNSDQIQQAQDDLIRYWQSRSKESESAAIRMLEHPDVRVRQKALDLIDRITRNRMSHEISAYLSIEFRYQLLTIVEDSNEDLSVREQAVLQLARGEQIGTLCKALEQRGPDGHFAMPTLAEFISDHEEEHWRNPKSIDRLEDLFGLLKSWGPTSAAAVPALIDIVENHPEDSRQRRQAVEALGAIGPAAGEAIPTLVAALKTASPYWGPLYSEAIEKIQVDLATMGPEKVVGNPQQVPRNSAPIVISMSKLNPPRLRLISEQIVEYGDQKVRHYVVRVENFEDYPHGLFAPLPNLSLNGMNESRTKVALYAAPGNIVLSVKLGIHSAKQLEYFRFNIQADEPIPKEIVLVLYDRITNERIKSNIVPLEHSMSDK